MGPPDSAALHTSSLATPVVLSSGERDAYAQLVRSIIRDAVTQYQLFCAPPIRRCVNPLEWQHIKTQDDVTIHKSRQSARHDPATLRAVDGTSTPLVSKSHVPWMLVTGTTPGTVDDLVYGAFMDSNATQRQRAFYVRDHAMNFTHLSQVTDPTEAEPLRFACISWAEIKDKGIPFVRPRDLIMLSASGTTHLPLDGGDTQASDRIGYYIVHSVPHPCTEPSSSSSKFMRGLVSFCYLFRQSGADSVEIFQRGFFAPMGDIPERAVVASITQNLLNPTRFLRAAYGKKLCYMMTHAPRNQSKPVTTLDGCAAGCRGKLSGRWRTQGECVVCTAPVCSGCKRQYKIAVGIVGLEVVGKALDFCVVCVMRSKSLHAEVFARRQLLSQSRQEQREWSRMAKAASSVSLDDSYQSTEPDSGGPRASPPYQTPSSKSSPLSFEYQHVGVPFRPHQYQTYQQSSVTTTTAGGIVLFPQSEDVVVNPRRVDSHHGDRRRGILL